MIFEFISEIPQYTVKFAMKINWRKTFWANWLPFLKTSWRGCLTFSLPPPLLEGVGWWPLTALADFCVESAEHFGQSAPHHGQVDEEEGDAQNRQEHCQHLASWRPGTLSITSLQCERKMLALSKRLFFRQSSLIRYRSVSPKFALFFMHLKWVVSGVPDTIYRCLCGKKFWNADKEKFWPNVTKKICLQPNCIFFSGILYVGSFWRKKTINVGHFLEV